jgi:hypothetical protein
MEQPVEVHVIRRGAAPGEPPRPGAPMTVTADTIDGLREAARQQLEARGFRVRALSFAPKGSLIAYAEENPAP